jgi:hypothetical protein
VETTSIQESIEKYSTQEGVDTLLGTGNSINLDNPEKLHHLTKLHRGQPKPFGWI